MWRRSLVSELSRRITFDPQFWDGAARLLDAAVACDGDAKPLLQTLRELPPPPIPGVGATRSLFGLLARIAEIDVTAARVVEPHFDAAAILAQGSVQAETGLVWGVFASASPVNIHWQGEAGEGHDGRAHDAVLSGTKRWCSLAGTLDAALVTASDSSGEWMFVLDLMQSPVVVGAGGAPVTGLRGVPSGPIELRGALASAIGDGPGWYTSRPGFAWGGIGVAAAWYGGATALGRALLQAATKRTPDQLALAWLGEADRLLHAVRVQLEDAADRIDAGTADWALAQQVRANAAAACLRLIAICGEALGPAPLAFDASHARRVADLTMYVSQHHGARDDTAHGASLLAASGGNVDGNPGGGVRR